MTTPSLTLVRRLRAAPERVFEAWLDPAMLAQWFGPHRTHAEDVACDPRVGGGFSVTIVEDADVRSGIGARHVARGRYREITPPARIVFDWWWEASAERVSLVTVTLRAIAGGTELSLRHTRFVDEASAARHVRGWTESLERLDAMMAEGGVA
jgi:uncharacterized protein YndB with AHSA1/START domain